MKPILEYTQKVINGLVLKFQSERKGLTQQQAEYYINKFDKVKSSHLVTNKDINTYTFDELEKKVDEFPSEDEGNVVVNTAEVEGERIYNKNNIEVYLGDSRKKCITYRKHFETVRGAKGIGWCISRSDASNMYGGYRYGSAMASRVFYFVIDRDLPITDPNHVFVVHVLDSTSFDELDDMDRDDDFSIEYAYTNAFNNDEHHSLTWNDLLSHAKPLALKRVPQDIFKPVQVNPEEQKLATMTEDKVDVDDLNAHFNGNYKYLKAYLELHMHELSSLQLKSLFDAGKKDLVNFYIAGGRGVEADTLKWLPGKLKKTLAITGKKVFDDHKYFTSVGAILAMEEFGLIPSDLEGGVIDHIQGGDVIADYFNHSLNGKFYSNVSKFGQFELPKDVAIGKDMKGESYLIGKDGRRYKGEVDIRNIKNSSNLKMMSKMLFGKNIDFEYPFARLPDSNIALVRTGTTNRFEDRFMMINHRMEMSVGEIKLSDFQRDHKDQDDKRFLDRCRSGYINTKYNKEYTHVGKYGDVAYQVKDIALASKDTFNMDQVFINAQGEPDVGAITFDMLNIDTVKKYIPIFIRQISPLPITDVYLNFGYYPGGEDLTVAKLDGKYVFINKEGKLDLSNLNPDTMERNRQCYYTTKELLDKDKLHETHSKILKHIKNTR
jgi:hypothetical protein